MNLYSDAHAKSRIEMFPISSQNEKHEIPVSMLVLIKNGPLYVLGILVERAMFAGKMPPIKYVRIANALQDEKNRFFLKMPRFVDAKACARK